MAHNPAGDLNLTCVNVFVDIRFKLDHPVNIIAEQAPSLLI